MLAMSLNQLDLNVFHSLTMSAPDFSRLSTFIYNHCGIKLPPSKKTMLEGRLHKRLRALQMNSYKAYCDYVFSAEGQRHELFHMIDVVTTNKTDFFREAVHFEYLSNNVLPNARRDQLFKVWSAACSTGEEPYTLAMVLNEYTEKDPGFQYSIHATDISIRALDAATTAVYATEKVAPIPTILKQKYLLKSKDANQKTVRIVPELRNKVRFERLNFIDGDFSGISVVHVIFCRNVLIYFDRSTQEKVLRRLCSKLELGGILCLGHSESIANMNLPLLQIQPTIFKKI